MLKWFSKRKTSVASVNEQNRENANVLEFTSSSNLTDADYDFLFTQLLDGVAHGWNQFRIIKFFYNLGSRGEEDLWVAWLEKFSTKIPDVTNDSQRRLGAIMLRLAEVTQSASELSQLSAVSSQIGKKLFFGKTTNLVWEYDGLDVVIPDVQSIVAMEHPSEEVIVSPIKENITEISISDNDISVEETSEQELQTLSHSDELVTTIAESTELENVESKNLGSLSSPESAISIDESSQLESTQEKLAEIDLLEVTKKVLVTEEKPETSDPENLNNSVMELVESWFELGLKRVNTGDLPGAIDSWHKALKLNPNLAEIWHNLGSAWGRLENYPKAVESFNRALEIDPQSEQAWNDRAHAFYQMQQWEQALVSWSKAIAINPGNQQFWYHQGTALEKMKRLEEALASYTKALDISPDFQAARVKYLSLITE